MAFTVQQIADRVAFLLIDSGNVRWTTAELIMWVNDAQKAIVTVKPDANASYASLALAAGTRQSISSITGAFLLLDVVRNTAGTKRAIRYVARNQLDTENPTWHNAAESATILHYTYDERRNTEFYVYPPAVAATSVEVVYAAIPADVAAVGNNVNLPDIYMPAVLDYVMSRAYGKDSDAAANQQLAEFYYSRFLSTLGVKAQAEDSESATAKAPSVART